MLKGKTLLLFLLAVISAVTLVNNGYYESPTMASYFLYMLAGSIFILVTAGIYYSSSSAIILSNSLPILSLWGLTFFYFIQPFFNSPYQVNMSHFFLLINLLLLLSLIILFKMQRLVIAQLYIIISILASLVAILCLCQALSLIKGPSQVFKVSGTWINPNVTAIFLTMSLPAALALYTKNSLAIGRFISQP